MPQREYRSPGHLPKQRRTAITGGLQLTGRAVLIPLNLGARNMDRYFPPKWFNGRTMVHLSGRDRHLRTRQPSSIRISLGSRIGGGQTTFAT